MFSYGEIFLTIAAAIALFGPNDVPIIARSAGRLVGRAVGYIQSARGQVDSVMKKAQVDQVQKELRETMAQLDAIRYEIRSGMSITNPGPMTRSVLNVERDAVLDSSSPVQVQSVVSHVKVSPPTLENGGDKVPETGSGLVCEAEELGRGIRSFPPSAARHLKPGGFEAVSTTASATVGSPAFQPGPDGTFSTMPPSTERIATQRIVMKPAGVRSFAPLPQTESAGTGVQDDVMQDVTILPISAVSAGILPPRAGPLSGGADLVLESVTERRVAFDAKEFLQQNDPLLR